LRLGGWVTAVEWLRKGCANRELPVHRAVPRQNGVRGPAAKAAIRRRDGNLENCPSGGPRVAQL